MGAPFGSSLLVFGRATGRPVPSEADSWSHLMPFDGIEQNLLFEGVLNLLNAVLELLVWFERRHLFEEEPEPGPEHLFDALDVLPLRNLQRC